MFHPFRRTRRDLAGRGPAALEGAQGRRRGPGLLETVARGGLGKGGLIAALALAACSTPTSEAVAPRTVEQAQIDRPVGDRTPADPTADLCGAGQLQWLVGKPKAEIPVPVEVVNRRVACTTCPVTEDYSPYRLNIFFNDQSQIVEQVRCG